MVPSDVYYSEKIKAKSHRMADKIVSFSTKMRKEFGIKGVL